MLKPITLISAAAMLFSAAIVPATADTPMESSHMHSTMMGQHGKGHGGHHGKTMWDSSSPKLGKSWDSSSPKFRKDHGGHHGMMGGHGKVHESSMQWGLGRGHSRGMMDHGKGHGKGHGPKSTM